MYVLNTLAENPALLVAAIYVALSLSTFTLYYFDKSAARSGRRRIRERTLHIFSVLGGWPGALAGQQLFRHKTRKQPFRFLFWCSVCVNLVIVGWFYVGDISTLASWINETL